MALMPKRVKYRKSQRGRIKGNATQGNTVEFGDYGMQALEAAWISGRQIEAARIAANHLLRHEGRVYIRIFPHKPVTSTPQETRMGKGKGEPNFYAAVVKPGTILFEVGGVPKDTAKEALNRMAHKLPCRVKMAERRMYQ
ncbi:MAG: 50S ribosomal protein L16 [Planctomycetes bacterium]|jgi:large subunit ribosomal protein L16|nr:50S ribosomal protein L16 [Planctomycetota bacterium]HNZ66003.1 50S ribosomal protein L16 [Planctomycetota bacterium]HPY75109.1 50S ribosomal protein L16 [Planctomycetota bacterium]HQB00677.1 50S ribosomal protein L16 [Planctomycetota bacterium]HRU51595.1 50S ribosomal protein L16 [Planctomycetota bacterium]